MGEKTRRAHERLVGRWQRQRSGLLRLAVPTWNCIADDRRHVARFLARVKYFRNWLWILVNGHRLLEFRADWPNRIYPEGFQCHGLSGTEVRAGR